MHILNFPSKNLGKKWASYRAKYSIPKYLYLTSLNPDVLTSKPGEEFVPESL